MKKRVLSMLLAFILCFSTLPMTAFAQEVDVVTEQEEQQEVVPVTEQKEAEAAAAPGEETSSDKSTTAGEAPDKSVSDSNAGTQETVVDDEKKAAVQKVQALIDALPETVTEDNAESVGAQLEAIDEAMLTLNEEQIAALVMERYEKICAALNAPVLVAVQAGEHNNTHPICGATCTHNDESHLLPADKEWQAVSTLTDSMAAGYYYLTNDVTLDATWTPANGTVLDLNGYSITVTEDVDAITVSASSSFTLTDCNSSGGVHYFKKNTDKNNLWEPVEIDGDTTVTDGVITHGRGKNGSGISVGAGGTFTMYGGTICGNYSTESGAGVKATKSKIIMSGGAISGNVAASNSDGGGVYLHADGSSFDMSGNAQITDNTTTRFGGGVYVNGGIGGTASFTMSGNAQITGNMCNGGSSCGGAGLYAANGEFTMKDSAAISNNRSLVMTGYGGGVFVSKDVTFTMNDNATISGNSAYVVASDYTWRKNTGGGVQVLGGTFIMNGGSISDNMAEKGAGVYVGLNGSIPGTFTMNGGTITNNKVIEGNGGGVYVLGNFRIANGASVKANLRDSKANNVYLSDGKTIEITGKLTDAKSVGVTVENLPTEINNPVTVASGDGTYTVDDSDEKAFFADADGYNVYYDKGELKLYNGTFHKHKVCVDTNCENCSHDSVIWEPISNEKDLRGIDTSKGKYYYLTDDIELTTADPWYPANGVVLDLCGHSIKHTDPTAYVISIQNDYDFTLTDCKGDSTEYGEITHGGTGTSGIYLEGEGTNFYFYGGRITGNGSCNGVVNVFGSFYMYGGEISGNTDDTDTSADQAAVYVRDYGKFNMSGGKITGNSVKSGCGGVYVKGAMTVSGDAQITGNTLNGKTSNVYLASGKSITVGGELSDSASIGVTSKDVPDDDNTVIIATATDNWIKDGNFITDSSLYKVTVSEDGKTANLGLHEHKWGVKTRYTSNRLQECCILEGCGSTTNGKLILTALDQKYSGAPYDAASYNKSGDWKHDPSEGEYYYTDSEGKKIPAPVNVGTYNVNLDVDGVTATQKFEITAENLYSGDFTFQGPENLTYDGSPKEATVTVVPDKADAAGSITVKYYKDDVQVINPTDAGIYTVKIDVTAGTGYNAVSNMEYATWKFTIVPKPVTITGISAQGKVYDGNTDAAITGKPEISGLVAGDENYVTVEDAKAKATFEDANAGESKTVTFGGYALVGAKAGNYKISQPASVTAGIAPKELTITGVTVEKKTYDGTAEATITDVTFHGLVNSESLTKDKDYTVTGNFGDAAVGENKDVAVTVKLTDSVKNYTLSGTEYKKSGCEISKATVTDPAATNLTIINGNTTIYTVMLPQLLPSLVSPGEYGSLTYDQPTLNITDSSYHGKAEVRSDIEYGKLALNFTDTGTMEGPIGTITVTVHSANYKDITLTINILATAKIVPQLEGTLKLTPFEITYGEKLSNITISGTMTANGREITGRFAWQNPVGVLNAGNQEATWKFIPEDTQTYAEYTGTTTVRVNKAEQSGAVLMYNYTYNETPKTPALTERKGDNNAAVTYYYSTTRTNSGGTEWKAISPTTLKAGTYYMYAVIGETGNYNKYTTEAKAFTVWTAEPAYTKPSGLTAKYGQKLSEITLPKPAGNMSGTWSWEAPDTVIDKTGKVSYDAVFTPDDKNYKEVTDTIEITVTPGDGRNLATEELKLAFNDSTDHTYTPDWSGLPAGQTWNYECGSSISNGSNATLTKLNVSAADGGLTYAVSNGKAGDEITVILKARCNNYEDFTITLNIQITKALPTGAPKYTLITTEGKILADAGLTLTDSTLKPAAGKLEWMDAAGNVLTDDTEVKVNTIYWWRFTPTDTNYDPLTGKVELYHVDAPAISAQPKSVSVTTGEKATFEVTATGTDVTYQWKIDRNDGNGFVDINGATGAAYTTGVTDKDCNGFKYQCVISNAAGSVTTDTVVLTVKEKYTITATAGAHGSISPSGKVEVVEGSSQIFVITAEDGYEIESLTVDGKSVDAVTSYTFENVTAAHTIAVTFKLQYKIIDGANGSWTQSTDGSGSLLIRGNGEFSKFLNVKVDGNIIDPTNYEARSGSTIIELKAEYLKTLSEGTHTFEIAWTDGTAKTSFTVARNTPGSDDTGNNDNDDNNKDSNNNSSNNNSGSNTAGSGDNTAQTLTGSPNTGDASGLWIALFMVSAAGLAVMLVRRKNSIKK